MFEMRKI